MFSYIYDITIDYYSQYFYTFFIENKNQKKLDVN